MVRHYACTECGAEITKGRKFCSPCRERVMPVIHSARGHKTTESRLHTIKTRLKNCLRCGVEFTPTGPCHKRCEYCSAIVRTENAAKAMLKYRQRKGCKVGVGSGGAQGLGEEHHTYKNGVGFYRRLARENYEPKCNHCGCDIDFSQHYQWCVHHKDHNRQNNKVENLEILCKRCHQIEHECWNNFPHHQANLRDSLPLEETQG